jgi:hypothetical protein
MALIAYDVFLNAMRLKKPSWVIPRLNRMQRIALIAFFFALAVMLAKWGDGSDMHTAKGSRSDATVGLVH